MATCSSENMNLQEEGDFYIPEDASSNVSINLAIRDSIVPANETEYDDSDRYQSRDELRNSESEFDKLKNETTICRDSDTQGAESEEDSFKSTSQTSNAADPVKVVPRTPSVSLIKDSRIMEAIYSDNEDDGYKENMPPSNFLISSTPYSPRVTPKSVVSAKPYSPRTTPKSVVSDKNAKVKRLGTSKAFNLRKQINFSPAKISKVLEEVVETPQKETPQKEILEKEIPEKETSQIEASQSMAQCTATFIDLHSKLSHESLTYESPDELNDFVMSATTLVDKLQEIMSKYSPNSKEENTGVKRKFLEDSAEVSFAKRPKIDASAAYDSINSDSATSYSMVNDSNDPCQNSELDSDYSINRLTNLNVFVRVNENKSPNDKKKPTEKSAKLKKLKISEESMELMSEEDCELSQNLEEEIHQFVDQEADCEDELEHFTNGNAEARKELLVFDSPDVDESETEDESETVDESEESGSFEENQEEVPPQKEEKKIRKPKSEDSKKEKTKYKRIFRMPRDSDSDSYFEKTSKEKLKKNTTKITDAAGPSTSKTQKRKTLEEVNVVSTSGSESEQVPAKEKKVKHEDIIQLDDEEEVVVKFVLDDKLKPEAVVVHPKIVQKLKEHQKEGIQFMYNNSYATMRNKYPTFGCILAHCMGLGKTLQLIALVHTVIQYPMLKTHKIMIICPKSTVQNWADEFKKWLSGIKRQNATLDVYSFGDHDSIDQKLQKLRSWQRSTETRAGVFLIGYEAFRILVNYGNPKAPKKSAAKENQENNEEKAAEVSEKILDIKKRLDQYLLKPGADLVVCDEGHLIKNEKSAINQAVTKIETKRRIILTGTPMQNNLNEYYCMVNFVRPGLLGTKSDFNIRYAYPIRDGQHADSTPGEIRKMKTCACQLYKKLDKILQRKEVSTLKEFLPEKFEYVLNTTMTDVQELLYEETLKRCKFAGDLAGKGLLPDFAFLRKIWTHPRILKVAYEEEKRKELLNLNKKAKAKGKAKENDEEDEDDEIVQIPKEILEKRAMLDDWWRPYISDEDLESLLQSKKLQIMMRILKECRTRGEKCLVFSGYTQVLNAVEYFFKKITNQVYNERAAQEGLTPFAGEKWRKDREYYRLDGKTAKSDRTRLIADFNDPKNQNVTAFLISARAGGVGINLCGANRVIILDTSWNPSNDQQNIFRIYRLGQKKPCYVYRLLAMGTMEERIYSRSVTKQAMSNRVIDKQQVQRHYNIDELEKLYELNKHAGFGEKPVPMLPDDNLLAKLLNDYPDLVFKYHIHDSLLANNPEEDLTEEEKLEAWALLEKEEKMESKMVQPDSQQDDSQTEAISVIKSPIAGHNFF